MQAGCRSSAGAASTNCYIALTYLTLPCQTCLRTVESDVTRCFNIGLATVCHRARNWQQAWTTLIATATSIGQVT